MPATSPTGTWSGQAFAHEAFLFEDDGAVVRRVVPFVQEGLRRGEPVLVVAGERVRDLLGEHLGADVHRLAAFAAAEAWWRGGHRTLQAYDLDLRRLRAGGRPWRLAAEPVWLARDDGRVWSRFEAVANRCYAAMPYYSLCLHDCRRLAPDVLDAVARTHPLLWDGHAPVPSPTYEDPESFVRSAEPAWSARPAGATTTTVTRAAQARAAVRAAAVGGWSARSDQLTLAVHELVTNALRAAGTAELSWWTSGGTLVWEVADTGPGLRDATAGYVPPPVDDIHGGRGLWLARSLADDATIAGSARGTAVRLYFR